MKKALSTLLHLAYWMSYLLLSMILTYALTGKEELGPGVNEAVLFLAFLCIVILPAIATFYTFYFALFPLFFVRKKIGPAFLAGAGVALVSVLIGFGVMGLIYPNCMKEAEAASVVPFILIASTFNFSGGAIAFIIKGFSTWFEEVEIREALQAKNHEMELALVKSQLDPHFLFNTINNIDVLILRDPEEASEYLNRLSDIMRFMLYETKTADIPLATELDYIKKYIALQKIRTANESYVTLKVSGTPTGRRIAPMVFIPFIENAFKHTTNKKAAEAIRIDLNIEPGTVRMQCVNLLDGRKNIPFTTGGLGDELIRKRLELLYPGRHELDVRRETSRYSVDLLINT
ncbi:sensor histidine kinase [Neolewinella antarctica]|uniref:Signal transduction histidine kinase internal region domain-containing protein n=1 Tax=Neolewinella antarctica TaxID=442734 RepID=A0ABX0XH63_9BACT|nr:sensor histidine kinase [Neolewinella antarctica]NJC28490.1 hypothetical protein [Neolewinella antarctica]